MPAVAGTASAGTEHTIELSRAAQSAGADGVQVVLPYYHVPSEAELVRHFLKLADALDIGVMIYNNSAVSKLWMAPHLMAQCAEHPNIVADKENADVVILSATTLINRTLDDLLSLCRNAHEVAILGPSTPLLPRLFVDRGVTLLSGVQVVEPERVLRIVSEGGGTRQFGRAVKKVTLRLAGVVRA